MSDIGQLIEFVRLTNRFREIERIIYAKEHPREESDAEHSFQLALAAWYLISSRCLELDAEKAMRYALAHDLVEVYAGDTYFYTTDEKERESKKERERLAAERLRREYPEFPELHDAIEAYEEKRDPESKFVYALDKLLPVINIYLDGGRGWRERGVTLRMLSDNKRGKVSVDPEIEAHFEDLLAILEQNETDLFPPAA